MNGVGFARRSANRKSGLRAGLLVYDVEGVSYLFQYRRYLLPLRAPVRTAHGVWKEREGVIVRIEDPTGGFGFGEAAAMPWFGTETVEEVEAACVQIGGSVDEAKLAAVPSRCGCLRNALASAVASVGAGMEMAGTRKTLAVAALLPAGRAAVAAVGAKAERGFRIFKWKVGVEDIANELGWLDDLCAALPSGAKLRLDANGAWNRRQAERWLERCAGRPVEFVEQPCFADASQESTRRGRADDLLMGLAGDWPTPIALDESLVGDGDVERWIGAGWQGVFVIKPSLLGDVAGALAQLEKARANVVFSSALETAVGTRAALRAAFAWSGEPRALGFGVWPLFVDARFDGPAATPFLRMADVEALNPEVVWNALT
jgi:o-succinylbenzoate synthase